MRTVGELLATATKRLATAGIESAHQDAELLFTFALGVTRAELIASVAMQGAFDEAKLDSLEAVLLRREKREPLQHITGLAPFRNLELKVGQGVFVPRPETEVVAQLAIDGLSAMASESPIAIDLGTGSGAIALSLATEVSHARIFAVEVSEAALPFTRHNFAKYAPEATLIEGDFAELDGELDGTVSVVVSNPPYIPVDAIPRDPEVRDYDPTLALFSGEDGFDAMRVISSVSQRLLHPGGLLVLEHADNQAADLTKLLLAGGWRQVRSHKDLTGRDRAITALK